MDALRKSKKISLLAVAIIFLFTFFHLILDAQKCVPNKILKVVVLADKSLFDWTSENRWRESFLAYNYIYIDSLTRRMLVLKVHEIK